MTHNPTTLCRLLAALGAIMAVCTPRAAAAELNVGIDNPPATGTVFAVLFNSADTFVDLRNPVAVVSLPPGSNATARIPDLPDGTYALVVYHDQNGNGRLDKNFIGIPREPLGFSNRYWAQGPPSFSRASFPLHGAETQSVDVALQSVFGKRGLLGVGVGVIAQTSAYRDSDHVTVLPIPAISYIGDHLQILGPRAQYGLLRRREAALAMTASYRLGAYREDDSDYLQGMGDRDGTLMGGLAVQAKAPAGIKIGLAYENDLLDRSGGGRGRLGIDRSVQRGLLTLSPRIALNWLTADLADYEYGVPVDRARDGRPAYEPGDAITADVGLSVFVELRGNWRVIVSGGAERLPEALTDSPIVDTSVVYSGFAAINRQL
ncbi:MAG: MipA/OmpV family protein [Lentisphaerae bacterium]|nr:MipA/OmpV family protein [Lentisphaerota bacterium]